MRRGCTIGAIGCRRSRPKARALRCWGFVARALRVWRCVSPARGSNLRLRGCVLCGGARPSQTKPLFLRPPPWRDDSCWAKPGAQCPPLPFPRVISAGLSPCRQQPAMSAAVAAPPAPAEVVVSPTAQIATPGGLQLHDLALAGSPPASTLGGCLAAPPVAAARSPAYQATCWH